MAQVEDGEIAAETKEAPSWMSDMRRELSVKMPLEKKEPVQLGFDLLPHQEEFVSEFQSRGMKGAVIADEMGLGKTIQALALVV